MIIRFGSGLVGSGLGVVDGVDVDGAGVGSGEGVAGVAEWGTMYWGDCLEVSREIVAGSVDLVLTDPPYGTVKGVASGEDIDHGMKGRTTWDDSLHPFDIHTISDNILRKNGRAVLFCQDPYTTEIKNESLPNMPHSYNMYWVKDHFANSLIAKKAPVSYVEDVLVFQKNHVKHDFKGTHPVRPYAAKVCEYINKPKKQIFIELGNQGMCHFMRHDSTQFSMCTEKTYNELIARYNINKMPDFRTYEDIKAVDRVYRDDLMKRMNEQYPSTFNLPPNAKYKSNVLQYKKDYDGHHPTQKPVALLRDIIRTYTNAGDLVADLTAGSFSTAVACIMEGRRFACIERDLGYFRVGVGRVIAAIRETGGALDLEDVARRSDWDVPRVVLDRLGM